MLLYSYLGVLVVVTGLTWLATPTEPSLKAAAERIRVSFYTYARCFSLFEDTGVGACVRAGDRASMWAQMVVYTRELLSEGRDPSESMRSRR